MDETQTKKASIDYNQIDAEDGGDNVQDRSSVDNESEETYIEEIKEKHPSSFWIASLRILSSLVFIAAVVFGLVRGIGIYLNGNELAGLLIFISVSLTAFMCLAVVMVFLNLAEDMLISRVMLERIRQSNGFR